MAFIHVLRTGCTLVSPAVPDRTSRRSGIAYTGLFQRRSRRIKVPVKCFLAEANGRRILVDTGWGSASVRHPLSSIGFGLRFASRPVLTGDETLESWFSRLGFSFGDRAGGVRRALRLRRRKPARTLDKNRKTGYIYLI